MRHTLIAGIIAVLILLAIKLPIVADAIDATYNTITSEIVLEIKTSSYGMEVIDCQVEITDFE